MRHTNHPFLTLCALLLLPLLACGPLPETEGLLGNIVNTEPDIPTLEAPPTPPGDTITFKTLTYRVSLPKGNYVPSTNIRYIQTTADAYEVEIDGLTALKQTGDSLPWTGLIAPGVIGSYALRLVTTFRGDLAAAGPVDITILNPFPIELPNTTPPEAPLYFNEIVLQHYIPLGYTIPGTTMLYQGTSGDNAEISGTAGYNLFSQGDSLRWTGQLRENVTVRYNFRIVSYNTEGLRLAGTAELWIR